MDERERDRERVSWLVVTLLLSERESVTGLVVTLLLGQGRVVVQQ